jgi:uncharacterized protein with von Willebrand factor type A (vWA) domain
MNNLVYNDDKEFLDMELFYSVFKLGIGEISYGMDYTCVTNINFISSLYKVDLALTEYNRKTMFITKEKIIETYVNRLSVLEPIINQYRARLLHNEYKRLKDNYKSKLSEKVIDFRSMLWQYMPKDAEVIKMIVDGATKDEVISKVLSDIITKMRSHFEKLSKGDKDEQ